MIVVRLFIQNCRGNSVFLASPQCFYNLLFVFDLYIIDYCKRHLIISIYTYVIYPRKEVDNLLKFAKLVTVEPDLGDDAVSVEEQVVEKSNLFYNLQHKMVKRQELYILASDLFRKRLKYIFLTHIWFGVCN